MSWHLGTASLSKTNKMQMTLNAIFLWFLWCQYQGNASTSQYRSLPPSFQVAYSLKLDRKNSRCPCKSHSDYWLVKNEKCWCNIGTTFTSFDNATRWSVSRELNKKLRLGNHAHANLNYKYILGFFFREQIHDETCAWWCGGSAILDKSKILTTQWQKLETETEQLMRLCNESIHSRCLRAQGSYQFYLRRNCSWCCLATKVVCFCLFPCRVTNLKRYYHKLLTRLCWQVTPSSGSQMEQI